MLEWIRSWWSKPQPVKTDEQYVVVDTVQDSKGLLSDIVNKRYSLRPAPLNWSKPERKMSDLEAAIVKRRHSIQHK